MEGVAKFIAVLIGLGLVFVFALVGGTFLWLIWPVAIPAAFPGLVASGVIAGKLSWWASVCLTWVFGLLVKASATASAKKE